jgi:F-type H+-transporting ATPase subunit c
MGLMVAIGAGIAVFTGIGAGIGIGLATKGLMEAISRQPEAANKMTPMFIIGVALAEATAIYGFVVAILLITSGS